MPDPRNTITQINPGAGARGFERRIEALRLAIVAGLPHRREAGRFAGNLCDRVRWAYTRCQPYLTITDMAKSRNGTLNRTTDRAMLRELQQMGLIRLDEFRAGRPPAFDVAGIEVDPGTGFEPYRFAPRWHHIFGLLKSKGLKAMGHNAAAMLQAGLRYLSVDAWRAAQKKYQEQRAERERQRSEKRRAAEQERRVAAAEAAAKEAAEFRAITDPRKRIAALERTLAALEGNPRIKTWQLVALKKQKQTRRRGFFCPPDSPGIMAYQPPKPNKYLTKQASAPDARRQRRRAPVCPLMDDGHTQCLRKHRKTRRGSAPALPAAPNTRRCSASTRRGLDGPPRGNQDHPLHPLPPRARVILASDGTMVYTVGIPKEHDDVTHGNNAH